MSRMGFHFYWRKMPWWSSLFIVMFLFGGPTTSSGQEPLFIFVPCLPDYECKFPFESFSASSSSCSCHPACSYFRDCCYDVDSYNSYVGTFNTSADKSVILDNILEYKEYYKCITDVITKERYRMVSKCPSDWTVPNQCEVEGDNQKLETVGNLKNLSSIPVVSADGVSFRNIHCAVCHGLATETLSPWSLQAECENLDFFPFNSSLSLEEKVQALIRNCKRVTFLPPTNHTFYSTAAIPCRELQNESEIYNVECHQNSSDEDKCLIVAAPLRIDSMLFRNKFCAECFYTYAMNQTLYLLQDCVLFAPGCLYDNVSMQCIRPTNTVPAFVPISITFNFGGLSGELTIAKGNEQVDRVSLTCEKGQVFDPTSLKCIYLTCPPGFNLNGSNCAQSHRSDTNASHCQTIDLKITIQTKETLPHLCSQTNITMLLKCLPINSTLFMDNGLDIGASCHTTRAKLTQITIEATVSHSPVFQQQFFMTSWEENLSSDEKRLCSDIDSTDISSFCSSSALFFDCDLLEYSEINWRINESSSSENAVITNTSETLEFSELKLRRRVKFSENLSMEESFYLHRCRPCPLVTVDGFLFEPHRSEPLNLMYSGNQALQLTPEMYLLGTNDKIAICNFFNSSGEIKIFFPQYSFVQSVMSTVGIICSTIALLITFITYFVFPSLRKGMAAILVMTLCACLMIAQVCLLFAGVAVSWPLFCTLVAGIGHLFWLATFATSTILGFVLNQTFTRRNQTVRGRKPSGKNIIFHLLSSFVVPFLLSGTLLVLYNVDGERFGIAYGNQNGCWIGGPLINLCAFGVPVGISLVLNLFFFLHVVISLCLHYRDRAGITKTSSYGNTREILIYVKIFVILGLTWTVGFAASFSNQEILWYIFIILTSLQGVFVFLSFTVKSKVWQLWRTKLCGRNLSAVSPKERPYKKPTPGTATSTF